MHSVTFSNYLDESLKKELENIFYFNSFQEKYYNQIMLAVKQYGEPRTCTSNGRLTFTLDKKQNSNALFMLTKNSSPSILGVLLYLIEENFVDLCFAVVNDHLPSDYRINKELIFLRMIEKLKSEFRNTKYEYLLLPYVKNKVKIKSKYLPIFSIIN